MISQGKWRLRVTPGLEPSSGIRPRTCRILPQSFLHTTCKLSTLISTGLSNLKEHFLISWKLRNPPFTPFLYVLKLNCECFNFEIILYVIQYRAVTCFYNWQGLLRLISYSTIRHITNYIRVSLFATLTLRLMEIY